MLYFSSINFLSSLEEGVYNTIKDLLLNIVFDKDAKFVAFFLNILQCLTIIMIMIKFIYTG